MDAVLNYYYTLHNAGPDSKQNTLASLFLTLEAAKITGS